MLHRVLMNTIGTMDTLHGSLYVEGSFPHWRAGQVVVFEVDLPVAPGRVLPAEFRTKCTDYDKTDERVNRDA